VPSKYATPLVVCDVAFVPPFAIASVPDRSLNERHAFAFAKHPAAMEKPDANVDVAAPVCAKFKTERPPEKVEVAEAAEVITPVLETEKSVVVAVPPVVEAIVKSVVGAPRPLVEVATRAS
jgi:hypothetical protein